MLTIGQRLYRSHNHRVTGMDSHRIDVFHVADHDCIIVIVPHNLVFNFLKACDTSFNQTLMYRGQL